MCFNNTTQIQLFQGFSGFQDKLCAALFLTAKNDAHKARRFSAIIPFIPLFRTDKPLVSFIGNIFSRKPPCNCRDKPDRKPRHRKHLNSRSRYPHYHSTRKCTLYDRCRISAYCIRIFLRKKDRPANRPQQTYLYLYFCRSSLSTPKPLFDITFRCSLFYNNLL